MIAIGRADDFDQSFIASFVSAFIQNQKAAVFASALVAAPPLSKRMPDIVPLLVNAEFVSRDLFTVIKNIVSSTSKFVPDDYNALCRLAKRFTTAESCRFLLELKDVRLVGFLYAKLPNVTTAFLTLFAVLWREFAGMSQEDRERVRLFITSSEIDLESRKYGMKLIGGIPSPSPVDLMIIGSETSQISEVEREFKLWE
jgi:hypothetical protein